MKYQAKRERSLSAEQLAVYGKFGISEKLSRLLFIRGIDTESKVEQFMDFSPERLHDPFKLRGMREAVDRINVAATNKEKILIIGDYDADGICSVAILYKYFLSRHVPTRYFLPERDADGYGLTCELIEKLNKRFKPDLIITVDCGISCHKEIEFAKSLGIDCIVTDHHAIPAQIPDCICVNPKFDDQEYPFKELCGAGVALKVVQALGGLEIAKKYLDICSIATVADIVSLVDENRVIVGLGLEMLNSNSLPSITALAKSCNVHGKITSTDISFRIGPKINASGRMGNAKRGLDIILEQKPTEIEKIIASLNNYNTARQKLCNTIYDEAVEVIEDKELYKNNIIIAEKDSWESGVLGIVSARVTEKYGKPSIVLGKSENIYKGSSRSIGDINIVKCIERFKDLIVTFGGHQMAAGLSVEQSKYAEFVEKITEYMNEGFSAVDLTTDKFYDFSVGNDDFNANFVRELAKLEPVGCENPAPVFMTEAGMVDVGGMNNFPQHIRVNFNNTQFMYFNGADNAEILREDFSKGIVFEFQKQDEVRNDVRAIIKGIIPKPKDAKSYALVLEGWLRNRFSVEDEKFFEIIDNLSVDRDVFIDYYKAIKQIRFAGSIYDTYLKSSGLEVYQFVFCATVFVELKILSFANGRVTIDDRVKADLFRSAAYNMIRNKTIKIKIEEKIKTE